MAEVLDEAPHPTEAIGPEELAEELVDLVAEVLAGPKDG